MLAEPDGGSYSYSRLDSGGGYDYGGGYVDSGGNQTFEGSGGMVGGLSEAGANYSVWGSAGSSYNSFTPSLTGSWWNAPSDRYRGLSEIRSGGTSLINSLNNLFSAYRTGGITSAQAVSQANQIASQLGNHSVFYQAQKGKDAALLRDLKAQAGSIVSAISLWSPTSTPTTPTDEDPTPTPDGEETQGILQKLQGLFAPRQGTSFETQPNLFSMTPENSNNGSMFSMSNMLILVVVAVAGWYLYKKYA